MTENVETAKVSRSGKLVENALLQIESEAASTEDKIEMLVEIAGGLQIKPENKEVILAAVTLYDLALDLLGDMDELAGARIMMRKGIAYQAVPGATQDYLEQSLTCYESAEDVLVRLGGEHELAEFHLNHGLVLQTLASCGKTRITDAVKSYQAALRIFDKEKFPREYAILHNNLATAFLSIPFTDNNSRVREALAVQSFEEGLRVINIIDHPVEYAMLQNNLGNALQYVSSGHAVENNLRALEAYDEALKVRSRETTPVEYANTLANKANCLSNIPDVSAEAGTTNINNVRQAKEYYQEAREIFIAHKDTVKADVISNALAQLEHDFAAVLSV